MTRRELAFGALIVVVALAVRVILAHAAIPGAVSHSEILLLRAAQAIQDKVFGVDYWARFQSANMGGWPYDPPLLLPVAALFVKLLGSGPTTIVYFGAFWGMLAVLGAWGLGRALSKPSFGLTWAALLAVSPLQIAWSRIGHRSIAAPAHVLGAMLAGYFAGKRRSPFLALVAGVLGFLSFYTYEAARVCIPLSVLMAVWGGEPSSDAPALSWQRRVLLGTLIVATAVLPVLYITRASARTTLWPNFTGAVGNRGEQSILEILEKNSADVVSRAKGVVDAYFFQHRVTQPPPSQWFFNRTAGGFVLFPVFVCGLLGLFVSLRRHRDRQSPRTRLILLLLGVGFVIPTFVSVAARRMLLFDSGWQAACAVGLLAVGEKIRIAPRLRDVLLALMVTGSGIWSLWFLSDLTQFAQHVPFPPTSIAYFVPYSYGDAFDIISSPRCDEVARAWTRDLAEGKQVVFIDSDFQRENLTVPTGLALKGYLAAFSVHRPNSFMEWYPMLENFSYLPDVRTYYSRAGEFPAEFRRALMENPHSSTLWHAERPTRWDWWFAAHLSSLGGSLRIHPTPLSDYGGFVVETPSRIDEHVLGFINSLRPLPEGAQPLNGNTLAARTAVRSDLPFSMLIPRQQGPATWAGVYYSQVHCEGGKTWEVDSRAGVVPFDDAGVARSLGISGHETRWSCEKGILAKKDLLRTSSPIGGHCAQAVQNGWWVLDAESGVLRGEQVPASLERGPWMGIAKGWDDDEILLLSPNQYLVGVRRRSGQEVFRIPAPALPNLYANFGECTQVVSGSQWVGILDQPAGYVHLFSRQRPGDKPKRAGTLDLKKARGERVTAIAGQGYSLGVSRDSGIVETWTIAPRTWR